MTDIKLDHLMISCRDPHATRAAYQRLGFTVGSLRNNVPMGGVDGREAGSTLILLTSSDADCLNYLELANFVPDTAMPIVRRLLEPGEGPAMAVAQTDDIDAARAYWKSVGIDTPVFFEADFVRREDIGGARHKIAIVDPDTTPFALNVVHNEDLAAYDSATFRTHANTARSWTALFCVCRRGGLDAVRRFAEYAYRSAARENEFGFSVDAGPVRIDIMTEAAAERRFGVPLRVFDGRVARLVGFEITADELDVAGRVLSENGVEARELDGTIVIPPDEAAGSLVQIVG